MRELAEKTPYITIADWNQVAKEYPEIWQEQTKSISEVTIVKIEAGAKIVCRHHCYSLANSSRQTSQI